MKSTSLYFNGSGTHIALGNPAAAQITGDQTIEMWIRPAALGKRQNPIAKAYGGEGTITLESDGSINYYYGTSGGNDSPYVGFGTGEPIIRVGEWAHIAIVRDLQNGTLRWYHDGRLVQEMAAPHPQAKAGSNPLTIGTGYAGRFHGEISEVRLWSVARTQAQLQANLRMRLLGSELGLAGYWPLDESGGAVAYDRSGRNNNGTINSGHWRGYGPAFHPRVEALSCDGSNDYVDIGSPAAVKITGDQTIELWMRPRVLGKRQNPIAKAYGGEGTITLETTGSLSYYCGQSGGNGSPYIGFNSDVGVQAGRWTHVAIVRDMAAKTLSWYHDGELVRSGALTLDSITAGSLPLRIGKGYVEDFDGDLSDVRLWSVARSADELAANYQRRLRGSEAGLAGYWPLDDGPGARAWDLSPNANDGVISNPRWTSNGPGLNRPMALQLDGSSDSVEIPHSAQVSVTGDQTIELWLRPRILGKRQNPIAKAYGGEGTITLEVNGSISYYCGQSGANTSPYIGFTAAANIAAGQWTHVAIVRDLGTQTLTWYIDGVETSETDLAYSSITASGAPLTIGSGYVHNFDGELTEVRLWSIARTEAEIRADKDRRLVGVEEGLAGYWPLAGGTGEGTEDRSRYANHGQLRADARIGLSDHRLPAAIPCSAALRFDGVDDYVQIGNPSAVQITGDQTIEMWLRPQVLGKRQNPLAKAYGGEGTITLEPNGSIGYYTGTSGANGSPYIGHHTPEGTVAAQRWTHVAIVRDFTNNSLRWVIDGRRVNERTMPYPAATAGGNNLTLAAGYVERFEGDLAEVRVWSTARTDEQIAANLDRRMRGTESGLAGYWPLSKGSGDRAWDLSEGQNHGTIYNAPRWHVGPTLIPATSQASAGAPQVGVVSGQSSLGASEGAPTTVQPAELPDALKNLESIEVEVMFVPFNLPIEFAGAVTVEPFAKAISYAGTATLTAPFDVSVDPLEIALAKGEEFEWMVKFGLPQSRSISTVIQDHVIAQIPSAIRPFVETLVSPYLAIYDDSIIILANAEGEDSELGSYLAGFNVFTTLMASEVPPFNFLHSTFPQLGLDTREVVLAVGAESGAEKNFFVGAALMLEVELGTSLIVFESISLNVSKQLTDTTVGAEIAFRLDLAGEILKLRGGIEATAGAGNSVTVWGALDAADGAWKDPFGIRGLTIAGLGVQVGATPTFPWIVLGVRGEVHIGSGLLGARVGILIDSSDASKCILDIYSEEGIDLPKLIDALTGSWLDVSGILDVAITDLQLYIAPKGGTIAGKSYDPGFKLGGKLNLWGLNAEVEGELDFDEGGSFKGNIDPIVLQAGGVEFLRLTSTNGNDGASVDVEFSRSKVGGKIDGEFRLLGGLYKSSTYAELSNKGFTAHLSSGGMGIYQDTSVTLEDGLFRLSYGPTIGVSVSIAGYDIGLSVGTTIVTEVDAHSFSQSISFSFSAMGVSYSPGPFTITVPFKDVGELAEAFYDFAKDLIVSGLLGSIAEAAQIAFDWVKTNVTAVAEDAAKFFENAGAAAADIAEGLVSSFGVAAGDAVGMLSVGAQEAASILKNSFNWSVDQTGRWLKDAGGFADDAVSSALSGAGYAASEVGDFMADVFGGSWIPFVDIIPHIDYVDLGGY
ncbi:VCBS [Plesiocystis pacifica SIR-1]|uniref:VCBS n=1 Tax=Plesiocystis pacifica SIR-1 TaxID=391625 RepID=A6FYU1_9BACT|nr:LamG domain-containing protein [Plesiocystis pacifica]EDM81096.1 VCBS [Plesiocystis pacifica SIR-1]